jgi:hypothetical protein
MCSVYLVYLGHRVQYTLDTDLPAMASTRGMPLPLLLPYYRRQLEEGDKEVTRLLKLLRAKGIDAAESKCCLIRCKIRHQGLILQFVPTTV